MIMKSSNIETIKLNSKILNKEMGVNIFLPSTYSEKGESLPVLYFLHGRSGNENIMFDLQLNVKANDMFLNKLQPMIIVCPRIENSRGINSALNSGTIESQNNSGITINVGRYEDYFVEEIIPYIDEHYNTIKSNYGRYIGGISGGGYAALHIAFRHQNLFCKVGGHMPAIELNLEEDDIPFFNDISVWEKNNPISIAKNFNISKELKVYLDAGNQDEGHFYEGCKILQNVLERKGVSSQFHLFAGHHNLAYILSNIEKYLEFYAT